MSEQMLLAIKYYSLILVRLVQGPGREQVKQRDLPRRFAALPTNHRLLDAAGALSSVEGVCLC